MADNYTMLKTILGNNQTQYEGRIPELTRQNITAVGNAILNYSPAKNDIINTLINKVALTRMQSVKIKNPFAVFKGEAILYGESVEDICVDVISAIDDTQKPSAQTDDDPFKRYAPDVKVCYHVKDDEKVYPVTIDEKRLAKAFRSEDGLQRLTDYIVGVLRKSADLDSYIVGKHMLSLDKQYVNEAQKITITKGGDTEVQNVYDTLKDLITAMEQPTREFNSLKTMRMCDKNDLVLIIRGDYKNKIDDYLKGVYNLSLIELGVEVIKIDSFDTDDQIAVLMEKDAYRYHEGAQETDAIYNPKRSYWNYFAKIRQLQSLSLFCNAVKISLVDGAGA